METGLLRSGLGFRQATVKVRLAASCAALLLLLLIVAMVSMTMGPVSILVSHVAGIMLASFGLDALPYTRTEELVIEQIRLPRILTGMLVGAALGVAGTTMQGLFRNPMADPGIIGVSAGAAAGAVLSIALGLHSVTLLAVPAFAFLGAMTTALVVYSIASVGGRVDMATLLLAGVAMNSFLGAIISAVIIMVPRNDSLREILFWLAGGLDARSWEHVSIAAAPIAAGIAAIVVLSRDLNLLMIGDEDAQSLGVRVAIVRPVLLAAACLVTGVAVAVSGTIAFVGLVVPHMLRIVFGPDHRVLVPVSAIGGALFVVAADTIARTIISPAELRVGILTSFLGAPFFLFLLVRNRKQARAF